MNEISAQASRTSLHDELAGRIREMIYSGELAGGDKVPEQSLCDHFGVSRTPLREAFKVLAGEGLLEHLPNRGVRVASISADDIDEIFPVMEVLEALAGKLACQRLTEAELAEIRALHYQMALHHTRGELPEYFNLNIQIHNAILKAAANPTLEAQYTSLAGRIRIARFRSNMSKERWDQAMHEHEEILAALEARDGLRLSELLGQHLENKRATVKQAIESGAGVAYD